MMDRLAQSPLRMAAGFGGAKSKSQHKYRVSREAPQTPTRRKRRLVLQPLTPPALPGATLEPRNEKLRHEFELALQRRDFGQLLWLVENGDVPATYETVGGETALLAAIAAKNEDAFRLVLQCKGVSIDVPNRHGYTPLMKAVAGAAPFAEAALIGATTTSKAPLRRLAVQTSNNRPDDEEAFDNRMVTCVLYHRPDLHARDAFGRSAFDWAARTGNHAALALMEARQQKLRAEHTDFADRDARLGECEAVLRRHDATAVAVETLLREPLLDDASLRQQIQRGSEEVPRETFVNALKDYGILTTGSDRVAFLSVYFVERETREGWTPLTKAAAGGFTETLQLILSLGVDVNYESKRLKHTALTWASYCGHDATLLALLRVPGLLIHKPTREGKTALVHAVTNQQLSSVRHLLHALHEQSVRRAGRKEAFHFNEDAVRRQSSPASRRSSRWGGTRPFSGTFSASGHRRPGTYEWHDLFLEMLLLADQSGRDAMSYATSLKDESETASVIHQELQRVWQQAQDHAAYVASHQQRTLPTACKYAAAGCDVVAPLDLLPSHELFACPKRPIDCERCGLTITCDSQACHESVECADRLVPCRNREFGCTLLVAVREAEAHACDHCHQRLVQCRLGCGKDERLTFDQRVAHETTQCERRLVECPLACGVEPFPANQRSRHKRQHCPKRLILCSIGCGDLVAVDAMAFHVATLCCNRRVACKWARHGCSAHIGGVAESRRHHEEVECAFRLVACRYDACSSREMLACFLDDHYAWQCSHEPVACPNDCGIKPLPRHLMDAHIQRDAGDCLERMARCRRDLCGKTLRLYDHEETVGTLTSDATALADAGVSMTGLRQRLERASVFLDKLRKRQATSPDGPEDENSGSLPVFWRVAAARATLLAWLEPWWSQLQEELNSVTLAKQTTAECVRILSFQDDSSLHLVEFQRDGHAAWLDLRGREYDVDDVPPPVFCCGFLRARETDTHEREACSLRLVPCPLACGQRLPAQAVAPHLASRCNLRNASCRLGCGAVLAFVSLADHELCHCERRQVTCDHCHAVLPHRTLTSHLTGPCEWIPRRCRLGCGLQIPSAKFLAHETSDCAKRLVPCPQCATPVWVSELESHLQSACALRVFGPCDAGCGVTLRVNERAHHLLFNCDLRVLPCAQCHAVVTWRDLPSHRNLQCPFRDVLCRRGCGQRVREKDALAHEDEDCARRVVYCENRCGESVVVAQHHEHLRLRCSMRVVACPSGCGDQLLAYQCERHARRCRQRLLLCGAGATHCARPIRLWYENRRLVACKTHGETGLLWAIKTQDDDLVAYFVQALEDEQLDVEFANGLSPLATAASLGALEIAKLLLRAGADVDGETSRGRTPLGEATRASDPRMVELLLAHRASAGHVNRHGQSVLAIAESLAKNAHTTSANAVQVLSLLKDQHEMDADHRELFRAITCSDYAYVASLLQHSHGVSSSSSSTRQQLLDELDKSQRACETAARDVDDSVSLLNESIADTEAKTTHTQRLRERVQDGHTQLTTLEQSHDASLAASSVLENELLSQIRSITALDLAALLNAATPPSDQHLVVMKSICLFCGVLPRGRRSASEYSDIEWWKTAQALLMDRALLSKLRGYRSQPIPPDVMAKVRRECLRTPAFPAEETNATREETKETKETKEMELLRGPSRRGVVKGDIVGRLAVWVRGVETEYKHQNERAVLTDKKRRLAVSLASHEAGFATAAFEMQVAARSLPARQHEVRVAQAKLTVAKKELSVSRQRLRAYRLVQRAASNGHTPLSFACAVGNDAMVHLLLTHGANGGPTLDDREACAALIQLTFRDRLYRRTQPKLATEHLSRSDAAVAALVRNVAQSFLLGHYRRKRHETLRTHRVPLHEAVYNGHWAIAQLLLAQGDATLWGHTHVFPVRAVPGASDRVRGEPASERALRRRGGWALVPLTGTRGDPVEEPRDLETRLAPLTIEETLRHAVFAYDSKLFRRDAGGWHHDETTYGETMRWLETTLATARAQQTAQRQEILARKSVAKKTRERDALHVQLDDAITSRAFTRISALLDDGAFADYETKATGLTALSVACSDETLLVENRDGVCVRAVALLLDRVSNRPFADFESSTGQTALSVAARWGAILCAQELLDRGAQVNYATRVNGETALMVAAQHGQAEFVRFLLRHPGTDVWLRDRDGKTAREYAQNHETQALLAAAMSGGQRTRVAASVSALYHVCQWGCGFVAPAYDFNYSGDDVARTRPLASHESETCPKRVVSCPLGCGEPVLWAEAVDQHTRRECARRRVVCPQSKCGVEVEARDLRVHEETACEWRLVDCECGEQMAFAKHVVHAANTCPQRLVACANRCVDPATGDVVRVHAWALRQHDRSECLHRRVRCRNGCAATSLLAKDRELHETQRCVLRRVECKWQCGETSVLAHAQVHHETTECLHRRVACPLKCGDSLAFLDLETHTATHCAHRNAVCSLGCGRKVPLHTMDRHVAAECRRRIVACPLQCGVSMEDGEVASHVASQCPHRLTACGLCGVDGIAQNQLAEHRETSCRMRVVRCRFQCYGTQPLRAHAQQQHEQWECALRPILCPLGCGETLIAHAAKRHEKVCDMRIVSCSRGCGAELRERDRAAHELRYCSGKMGTLPQGKV